MEEGSDLFNLQINGQVIPDHSVLRQAQQVVYSVCTRDSFVCVSVCVSVCVGEELLWRK